MTSKYKLIEEFISSVPELSIIRSAQSTPVSELDLVRQLVTVLSNTKDLDISLPSVTRLNSFARTLGFTQKGKKSPWQILLDKDRFGSNWNLQAFSLKPLETESDSNIRKKAEEVTGLRKEKFELKPTLQEEPTQGRREGAIPKVKMADLNSAISNLQLNAVPVSTQVQSQTANNKYIVRPPARTYKASDFKSTGGAGFTRPPVLSGYSKTHDASKITDHELQVEPGDGNFQADKLYVVEKQIVSTAGEGNTSLPSVPRLAGVTPYPAFPRCSKPDDPVAIVDTGSRNEDSINFMKSLCNANPGLSDHTSKEVIKAALFLARKHKTKLTAYMTACLNNRGERDQTSYSAVVAALCTYLNNNGVKSTPNKTVLFVDGDTVTKARELVTAIGSTLVRIQGGADPQAAGERKKKKDATKEFCNQLQRVLTVAQNMPGAKPDILKNFLVKQTANRTVYGMLVSAQMSGTVDLKSYPWFSANDQAIVVEVMKEMMTKTPSGGSGFTSHDHGINSQCLTIVVALQIVMAGLEGHNEDDVQNFYNELGHNMILAGSPGGGAMKTWTGLAQNKATLSPNVKKLVEAMDTNRANYSTNQYADPNISVSGKPATHKATSEMTNTYGCPFSAEYVSKNFVLLVKLYMSGLTQNPILAEGIRTFSSGPTYLCPPLTQKASGGFIVLLSSGRTGFGSVVGQLAP